MPKHIKSRNRKTKKYLKNKSRKNKSKSRKQYNKILKGGSKQIIIVAKSFDDFIERVRKNEFLLDNIKNLIFDNLTIDKIDYTVFEKGFTLGESEARDGSPAYGFRENLIKNKTYNTVDELIVDLKKFEFFFIGTLIQETTFTITANEKFHTDIQ